MRTRRTLAAVLVATLLSAGALITATATPAAAATESVDVVVAPDDGGVVRSGKALGVAVAVTNSTGDRLPAGRLTFSVDSGPVASTSAFLSGPAVPPEALQGQLTTASADVPALDPASTATVRATLSKDDLTHLLTAASGARRLYVQYQSARTTVLAESSIVKMAAGSDAKVSFATVIPLTAPAGTTGVVDVDQQQTLVDPRGRWGSALRAAEADPAAAIALDPEVIASIRLAGDAAPPEAREFLDRLGRLPNEFLRLPYADTDVTLARAAGAPADLEPTSFAGATAGAADVTGPTPAPTATAGATSSSSATDLTQWNWSERTVSWPLPGTTGAADLGPLSADGRAVLLSSSDLQGAAARAVGPVARIGSAQVLVSDASASSLLSAAGAGGVNGAAALAKLTGLLATAAATGDAPALLATTGRSTDATDLERALDLLNRQPWVRPTSLAGLGDAASATRVQLKPGRVAASSVTLAEGLLAKEDRVQQLGRAVPAGTSGDVVTAPQRLALLGALSASWRGEAGWPAAAAATESAFSAVVDSVRVTQQSSANLVGGDGTLPVVVANSLPVPVRVVIHAGVDNGAVRFAKSSVEVTVPANGSAKGELSFNSIRNGRTDLTLSITTPNGTPLGSEVTRRARVQAGFDTIVAVVLLAALGLLLTLGVYRNVKRRRQPRTAAA